jgi:hypothetical protein
MKISKQDVIKAEIDMAYADYVAIAKEEIEGDYSDAMLSMERTEATGRLSGLQFAYFIFFGETYEFLQEFDADAYNDEVNG